VVHAADHDCEQRDGWDEPQYANVHHHGSFHERLVVLVWCSLVVAVGSVTK
jgi:hypothetical protein